MNTQGSELRTGEVASMIGVSDETVRQYTKRGMLDCRQLPSGRRRYTPEDVMEFMERTANKFARNSADMPPIRA